jgi:hypothetical protein
MPRRVPDLGPLTEGPGPTSSPGSLRAPRVACRCLPMGFDRQHILTAEDQEPISWISLEGCDRIEATKNGVRLVLSTGLTE